MISIFSFAPLLDNTINKPIYYQLYEYIKEEILNRNIKGEEKLPSLRKLSQNLHLSKNTIEAAYNQLYAEGYIESIPKVGYKVIELQTFNKNIEDTSIAEAKFDNFNNEVDYKYDLAPRYIDKSCFNIGVWKRICSSIINNEFESLLHFSDSQGEYELREQIAKYVYESRGVHCHPNQIIVGAGTQYCLGLLCQMLRNNYDTMGMEEPGSNYVRFIFERYKFNIEPIEVHEQGLNVDQLENSKCKVVFTTPSHQFPKGVIMSASNRLQLLNWAQNNAGIIIEDDYDSEMRFTGKPIPSLKSFDKNDKVIYLGSFSKIFIPTARVSYMILPHKLLTLYIEKYKVYAQTASKLEQLALARFIKEGYLQSHIRKTRKHYFNKYNNITKAVQCYMKDKVNLISSNAGMRVILEIKTNFTEEQIISRAQNAGINITPISQYYMVYDSCRESDKVKVLLSYKGIPIEDIEPAIKALSDAWFK
jgi:GntR family transcriptional regulator/MocR family aminotransferase